jgi:hypothetical protein
MMTRYDLRLNVGSEPRWGSGIPHIQKVFTLSEVTKAERREKIRTERGWCPNRNILLYLNLMPQGSTHECIILSKYFALISKFIYDLHVNAKIILILMLEIQNVGVDWIQLVLAGAQRWAL